MECNKATSKISFFFSSNALAVRATANEIRFTSGKTVPNQGGEKEPVVNYNLDKMLSRATTTFS